MAASAVMDPTSSRRSSVAPSSRPVPRSRTQSVSSDRPSTIMSPGLSSPPLAVSPEAAFIAASAASQIVTNDHDSHATTWYDEHAVEPNAETAMVSPGALLLVNNFLDQLLFNFLHVSRGTTLQSLRPAVTDILKPRLAKDAINNADEELREYLGGGDEHDFDANLNGDAAGSWDLELVWKRTRLRCMVYSSLGDMEEDDEDFYTEQENLEPGAEEHGSEIVSPAVAIFLTSILEFMGEAALVVAGQAAYHRMQAQVERELKEGLRTPGAIADRIVVEELDMERVALDRTLGRLWRAWKKRIRSPGPDGLRPLSRASFGHLRKTSSASELLRWTRRTGDEAAEPEESIIRRDSMPEAQPDKETVTEGDAPKQSLEPSDIPLPVDDRDIEEIEVPGLVSYSDTEESDEEDTAQFRFKRPKSLVLLSQPIFTALPTPPLSPIKPSSRKRSSSLPSALSTTIRREAKRPRIEVTDTDEQKEPQQDQPEVPTEKGTDEAVVVEPVPEAANPAPEETEPAVDEAPAFKPRSSKRQSVHGAQLLAAAGAAAILPVSKSLENKPGTTTAEKAQPPSGQDAKQKAESIASDDEADDLDDEEPQILTSARVSITGRSSPAVSDAGKVPSINTNTLQRTPSVHSARVIDVVGPKSPIMPPSSRSRTPSVEAAERMRAASISRASNGLHTPPIAEEEKSLSTASDLAARGATSVPRNRSPVEKPARRPSANPSISEVDEDAANSLRRPARTSSIPINKNITPINTDLAEQDSEDDIDLPIFGSVVRQPGSPRQDHSSQSTKVTILSNTQASAQPSRRTSNPSTPRKSPVQARGSLPDERQVRRPSSTSPDLSGSIGIVSVERHSPGRDSTERRRLHTSGSSVSSAAAKIRPVRTSEDSKGSSRANDNVARNFEELIQSDETIQYTLTPENMRDDKPSRSAQNSPVVGSKSRRSEEPYSANTERSRSSSNAPVKRSTSVSRTTGLHSHPIQPPKPKGYIPRAPPGASSSATRAGGPQARDARVARESVLDFADFIRSTGPTADNGPAPLRGANGQPLTSANNTVESKRSASNSNRNRLQAREAVIDGREDNSDLIDFIRRGPQNSANPRIPRHVAPFRSTMDSDQMSGAVGGKAVDASIPDIRYSQASTNMTDVTMPSVQSSVNSQSALIKNNRSNEIIDEEDMMPKRTRRRVKDPYAIDFSDEEDDELFEEAPRPPPKKEESLAEFLRNYEPPPEPTPQIIPQNKPKKKLSAPSLMGRFSRGLSSSHGNKAPSPAPAAAPAAGPSNGAYGVDSRSTSSRSGGGRGYVPIQVNMPGAGLDVYGGPDRPSIQGAASTGRVPMKRFEPRDAVSQTSRTNDLANFLRDSEPPPGIPSNPVAYSPREPESTSSFSKVFGRRKKSTAA
ncbi:hypothetical protein B0T11DRAFT_18676 [Plectosphaerella cucumerina]|uniref:Flo11 n=1 Tax=Plectosphaerella cucumerina TaxID=40658 RepID=A0A8K0TTF5_9PEZI|nr:hypothetical protein B0T11DRAFT_18676 [Plectosphaerella cucumerina]